MGAVMVEFRSESVSSELSATLLTEYFEFRAATFPVAQGYVAKHPDPHDFEEPHGVFLVAHDDSHEAIGCGGVRDLGDDRWEIKHLWIRPAARGLGLGRRMLTELERRAEAMGARELVLDTNASLEAAGSLYRSAGFESIEPYNDNPNANLWFAKNL